MSTRREIICLTDILDTITARLGLIDDAAIDGEIYNKLTAITDAIELASEELCVLARELK